MAWTHIQTYVSRIETCISTFLTWDKSLYLAGLENSHLEITHVFRNKGRWTGEIIDPDKIAESGNLIGVLDPSQHDIKDLPFDEKSVFDETIWLEENRKELFPPGLAGKDFYIKLVKKGNRAKVFLISKKVHERMQQLSEKKISILLLADKSDNVSLAKGILSGSYNEQLFFLTEEPHPYIKDIVQRWIFVFFIILLFGFSSNRLLGYFLDFRYNDLQEKLIEFSTEQAAYANLKEIKNKLHDRLNNINRYKCRKSSYAANISEILKLLPDQVWVKSYQSQKDKMVFSFYTTDLKEMNEYEKNLERLSFILQISALKIEKAKARNMRKQYGVTRDVHLVELQVKWT